MKNNPVLGIIASDDLHETERRARIALSYALVPGDTSITPLLRTNSAATVLEHLTQTGGLTVTIDTLRRALDLADDSDHRALIPGDPDWPVEVDALGDTAPVILWARGDVTLLSRSLADRVTVTGSRASTGYGNHVASEVSHDLAGSGRVILTGAAYGIDAAATKATLAADGATIAVLASGIDRAYPVGNAEVLQQVASAGLIVSETPPGVAPSRTRFLQRARLIAALSATVVIVEAGYRSSVLCIAHHGLALCRAVAAVPGPVTSVTSAGCHRLIQDGETRLVTSAQDILALTESTID